MTTVDSVLLIAALGCCAAIIARAGDVRVWAAVAGALIVAVLLGVEPLV